MNKAVTDSEMGFWDHVDALRGVLWRALTVVGTLTIVVAAIMPAIFDTLILGPCHPRFFTYRIPGFEMLHEVQLINTGLSSQLMTHFSTSLAVAFVLALPLLLKLAWNFLAPALYENERRLLSRSLLSATAMFYLGMLTGYALVFPLALRFLTSYSLSSSVQNILSLSSYIDNMAVITSTMGLLFELPLVAWLLGRAGLIDRAFFGQYRRHAVVLLLILAAVVTPTTDPFSLMVVFIPVYSLWEAGALLVPRRGEQSAVSGR